MNDESHLAAKIKREEERLAGTGHESHVDAQMRTARIIEAYESILHIMGEAGPLDDRLHRALGRLRGFLEVPFAEVLEQEDGYLAPIATVGIERPEGFGVALGSHLAGRVSHDAQQEQSDVEEDIDPVLRAAGIRRVAAVPLEDAGRRIGVLQIGDGRKGQFTPGTTNLLRLLAVRFANALAAGHLRERLEQEKERAEQLAQMKTRLLQMASHDLRTPLSAVITNFQMVEKGLLTGEEAAKALRVAGRNLERLRLMMDDFLDLSRLDADRLSLHPVRVDVADVLSEVCELYARLANNKGIGLAYECRSAPTEADENRLRQVLHNLISNAIRYTPEGGHIQAQCGVQEGRIVVEVKDTGPGMDEEQVARALRPFEQVQGAAAEKSGAGLGLYLSQQLIEEHGGTLSIDSRVGQGTTVRVELPAISRTVR